jgi:hypothetical protein
MAPTFMFLKESQTDQLVEVVDLTELINPSQSEIKAQMQAGQNEQPSSTFAKSELMFPSGEPLPRCWVDAHYRDQMPAE